jgi:hypothetical protein
LGTSSTEKPLKALLSFNMAGSFRFPESFLCKRRAAPSA